MRTKKPLTRAEIAAAYRRRQAQEKRTELRELVALAYEIGRLTSHRDPIPPTRLLTQLREMREARKASKTSKRAAAYLALLEDTRTPNVQEIREPLTPKEDPALTEAFAEMDKAARKLGLQ